jgi:hypothetical protein
MGVANVTTFADSVNPTDVLSNLIAPALVKRVCMMNLMSTDSLPEGTLTKLVTRRGSLSSAAILAEATAQAVNAQLTDTSTSLQIAKAALVSGISVEQLDFGNITLGRMAQEHADDIARFVDNDSLSLFTSFTNSVTATSVLTIDDLELGAFNIYDSDVPNPEVPFASVLSHRGHLNIKQELRAEGASAYRNESFLQVLQTNPQPNCFVGNIPGIGDIYATSGHQTSGGDTVQAIFHPVWALAGAFAPAPVVWIDQKGSEGFYTEAASYYYYDVIEFLDAAGTQVLSDT